MSAAAVLRAARECHIFEPESYAGDLDEGKFAKISVVFNNWLKWHFEGAGPEDDRGLRGGVQGTRDGHVRGAR